MDIDAVQHVFLLSADAPRDGAVERLISPGPLLGALFFFEFGSALVRRSFLLMET